MDIFIDTSVMYTDPFWKRNYPKELFWAAEEGLVTLYFSDVVVRELRFGFKRQLEKELDEINSADTSIAKLSRKHISIKTPDIERYLKDFDAYYDRLFLHPHYKLLKSESDLYEEILERAISHRKPFTDKKSEFKDAVIWATYYKYANANNLKECHFLTNNTSDFADKEGNLHPELKADNDKFKIYVSIDEFYKAHKEIINKPITEFKNWLDKKALTDESIFDLLFENVTDKVENEIRTKYNNIDPTSFVDDDHFPDVFGGYTSVDEMEWYDCEDIEIEVVRDYAIISGVLNVNLRLELYSYNTMRDPGEEKFPYFSSVEKEVKVYFNFVYDKEEKPRDFEVLDLG